MKKGIWIYWRWKDDKTWSNAYIQEVVKCDDGIIIELSDNDMWSKYPTRVSAKDIEYKIPQPVKQ